MSNQQESQTASIQQAGQNSEVTAIIEQVIERVRHILDHFEQVVDEAFSLIEMVRALFREIKDLFSLRSGNKQEADDYLEYA